jgi:apolipoprotein N-acyltransferase
VPRHKTSLAFGGVWGKLPRLKLLRSFILSRYPWAILAGLLLAASFPKLSIAGFAWIAPGLMLLTAIGKPARQSFRIGYVAGLAHYLASLYWLLLIPSTGFPILGWAALSAFLALWPATWVWLCWKLFPARLTGTGPATLVENWGEQFLAVAWARRVIWALTGAALWVALEMTVARIFGGFPWNLLGSSQYRMVPLIQIASVTGIYGVSFLVVWTSLSLVGAVMVIIRQPVKRSAWIGEMILPMLAVSVMYASGYVKLLRPQAKGPELTVALVQPSIPQSLIWDPKQDEHRFQQLLQLSDQAALGKPDLMIWPEAALPKMLRYDEDTERATTELAHNHKMWMIVGSDDEEPRRNAKTSRDSDYFNSSFLISPDGRLMERYVKRNLVIFGEYIPFLDWLPFIKYLTPIDGVFTPGKEVVPFALKNPDAKVSVLICFEDCFPHLVREYVSDDTDFLVNITNDGWFGEGAAQWQHAAGAIFRAVENGLPLVRCANNGLTCWIDSRGRLREVFKNDNRGIYGPGFLLAKIPVLPPGEKRAPTFYRQHGDVFGWSCAGFVTLQLLRLRVARRHARRLLTKPGYFEKLVEMLSNAI